MKPKGHSQYLRKFRLISVKNLSSLFRKIIEFTNFKFLTTVDFVKLKHLILQYFMGIFSMHLGTVLILYLGKISINHHFMGAEFRFPHGMAMGMFLLITKSFICQESPFILFFSTVLGLIHWNCPGAPGSGSPKGIAAAGAGWYVIFNCMLALTFPGVFGFLPGFRNAPFWLCLGLSVVAIVILCLAACGNWRQKAASLSFLAILLLLPHEVLRSAYYSPGPTSAGSGQTQEPDPFPGRRAIG